MNEKKRLVLRAPVLTQSGYGVHGRQVARWLLSRQDVDLRVEPVPWGDTPWILDRDAESGLIGQIMDRSKPSNGMIRDHVSFQLQLPNEWDPKLAEKNVGLSAVVETDRCNPDWVKACQAMDLVIVPSQHSKLCIDQTRTAMNFDLTTEVKVVPESFFDACSKPVTGDLNVEMPADFCFLVFGQMTGQNQHNDRKSLFASIKWLCETFKDDPNVGIVVKTNTGRNSLIDRNIVINTLKQLLAEVKRGPYPKIKLLHGAMNDEEVVKLYRHPNVKALVALTKGEGFGLPILEAAACGLPIIATGWSGHTDFLKKGQYINVSYQLSEIHPSRVDNGIFVKGSRWALPSEEDAKRKFMKFRESPATPQGWARQLSESLLQSHQFSSISAAYDSATSGML